MKRDREVKRVAPCGVVCSGTVPAQHQHLVRLLMMGVEWKHKLSRCGHLSGGWGERRVKRLESQQEVFMIAVCV